MPRQRDQRLGPGTAFAEGAKRDAEVVVLLSGGADSAACVQFFLDVGRPTAGLFLDYQQQALKPEAAAARRVADHYAIPLLCARWTGNLTKGSGFVTGRNGFLLMAALMERPGSATGIAIGIHAGTDYADCSPPFVDRMQAMYDVYTSGRVKIVAPFLEWSKGEIFTYARSSGVPLGLTYSCEVGSEPPCRRCRSCLDRELLDE